MTTDKARGTVTMTIAEASHYHHKAQAAEYFALASEQGSPELARSCVELAQQNLRTAERFRQLAVAAA